MTASDESINHIFFTFCQIKKLVDRRERSYKPFFLPGLETI